MFDRELFYKIAKEMGIKVEDHPGRDKVNGEEVDFMEVILSAFDKPITSKVYEQKIQNDFLNNNFLKICNFQFNRFNKKQNSKNAIESKTKDLITLGSAI